MDDRPHKAHRAAQSGGKVAKKDKGKEKQKGNNEKVRNLSSFSCKLDRSKSSGIRSEIREKG